MQTNVEGIPMTEKDNSAAEYAKYQEIGMKPTPPVEESNIAKKVSKEGNDEKDIEHLKENNPELDTEDPKVQNRQESEKDKEPFVPSKDDIPPGKTYLDQMVSTERTERMLKDDLNDVSGESKDKIDSWKFNSQEAKLNAEKLQKNPEEKDKHVMKSAEGNLDQSNEHVQKRSLPK